MFTVRQEILRLEGRGEEEKIAFQEIFNQIKPKLAEKYPGVLLQIEPLAMDVVDAEVYACTERFLGFLFPRRRHTYKITADLTVKVSHFDTAAISYRQTEERLSTVQRVLKMR